MKSKKILAGILSAVMAISACIMPSGWWSEPLINEISAQADTAKSDKFTWGKDNWSFTNTSANFGSSYGMDEKYLSRLKATTSDQEWENINKYFINSSDWAGVEYGMSVVAFLAMSGYINFDEHTAGATCLNDLKNPKDNSDVKSLINYYNCSQLKSGIQSHFKTVKGRTNEENIKDILKKLEKSPAVIVSYYNGSTIHAALAYGVSNGTWTKNNVDYDGRIEICDANCKEYNADYCIYYNSKTYDWAVPAFYNYKMNSQSGGGFNMVLDDAELLADPELNNSGKFIWGKDNWSFINSSANFDSYGMDEKYLKKLQGNTTAQEWGYIQQYFLDTKWSGADYGMCMVAFLAKAGYMPFDEYTEGAKCLHDLQIPKNNSDVQSIINYYLCAQVKSGIQSHVRTVMNRTNEENIKDLLEKLETNSPVMVTYSNQNLSHTVLAYDVTYGSWTKNNADYDGRIEVYDANCGVYSIDNCIYFNSKTCDWAVPARYSSKMNSKSGASFHMVLNDIDLINDIGYLTKPQPVPTTPTTTPTTQPATTTTTTTKPATTTTASKPATTTTLPATTTTTPPATTTLSTTTFPVNPGGFKWGRDNWNFNNSSDCFVRGKYFLDDSYSDALRKNMSNKEWENASSKLIGRSWGGSCYGMSALTMLANRNFMTYGLYTKGADCLNKVQSPAENDKVESLINYYHILQVSDRIQQHYINTQQKTNEQNIKDIIDKLKTNQLVLVGYEQRMFGGHSVVAYAVNYQLWNKDGVDYNGRIEVIDPNCSMDNKFNENACIYFNTETYDWTVPRYEQVKSSKNARFNMVLADTDVINSGGYLDGVTMNFTGDYKAILTVDSQTDPNVSRALRTSDGVVINQSSDDPGDIVKTSMYLLGGEGDESASYILKDAKSAYRATLETREKMELEMNYENCRFEAQAALCDDVFFDPDGFASIEGAGTNYSISMIYNENLYPTDWYKIAVNGENADKVSLEKTKDGYIMRGNNLSNVNVAANNYTVSAQRQFSTDKNSVLIYEIDEKTIGIKVDSDGDGKFDTDIADASDDDDNSSKTKVPADAKPTAYGDTNLDGAINIADVVQLNKFLLNKKDNPIEGSALANSDCMKDGYIDSSDSTLLMNYVSMQITEAKLGTQ